MLTLRSLRSPRLKIWLKSMNKTIEEKYELLKRNLKELNKEHNFFKEIYPLEHPRYIMQYKTKQKEEYVKKFVEILKKKFDSSVICR